MLTEDSRGTFDKLVAGLTSEERTAMLNDINASSEESFEFVCQDPSETEKPLSLSLKLKGESLLYRFLLWFRGLIRRESSEQVYSDDLLAALAHRIPRAHPGLVNHKIKALDGIFHTRLQALKDSSDFFKPYMVMIDDNPGEFYVFLCSFITPKFIDDVTSKADPFILDFNSDDSQNVKNGLVKALEDELKNIDPKVKNVLYESITALNWLMHFCKLPYLHFLAQFTNIIDEVYTCPYRNAAIDYDALSAVFTNVHSISNELLEAIFLFSQKSKLTDHNQQKDIERTVKHADPDNPNNHQMAAKYALHDKLLNVDGTVLWYAKAAVDDIGKYATNLRKYYWRYPALQPRMPFIDDKAPKKPKKVKAAWTEYGYVLSWQPPKAKSWKDEVTKYVVYKFAPGESVNTEDASKIVTITGRTSLVMPYEDGTQKYTYVVTTLDRMSNESAGVKKKVKL